MNKNIQRWQDLFHSICPDPGANVDPSLIFNHARPTFFRENLSPVAGSELKEVGLSRLDHLPDLPRGMDWPQHKGKALDFVAQINLSDLETDFHPTIPITGWLYFFVGDTWDGAGIQHRVLHFDGAVTDLVRTKMPETLRPPEWIDPRTALLTFRSGFSYDPKFLDKISQGDFLFDPQFKAYSPLRDALYDSSPDLTRLGGYPYAFQGGGHDHDALFYLNDFQTLIKHGWFDLPPLLESEEKRDKYWKQRYDEILKTGDLEKMELEIERFERIKDHFEEQLQPIEMLIGLESELGRVWQDAGFLEFFIRQDDLAQHDFSRTYCEIISA